MRTPAESMPDLSFQSMGRQQGFTLLEVLAAFVIFALSVAVIFEIIAHSARNTRNAEINTTVALLAQSKLDMLGVEAPLQPGQTSGEFNDRYRWLLNIQPLAGGATFASGPELNDVDGLELLQVDLVVSWGDMDNERSAQFLTLRANPLENP